MKDYLMWVKRAAARGAENILSRMGEKVSRQKYVLKESQLLTIDSWFSTSSDRSKFARSSKPVRSSTLMRSSMAGSEICYCIYSAIDIIWPICLTMHAFCRSSSTEIVKKKCRCRTK